MAHLRSTDTRLDARKLWPSGIETRRGRIGAQAEEGRALTFGHDPGWFSAVSGALADAARIPTAHRPPDGSSAEAMPVLDPALVAGCAGVLKRWPWAERPTWITWVPSVRRPRLAEAVATELARLGRLILIPTLGRCAARPAQDTMANSTRAARNALGAFEVVGAGTWPTGPVLVVDDTVRSGWTMAVVAELLRDHGSGPVLPFALWKRP